jgi:hypothetical protein
MKKLLEALVVVVLLSAPVLSRAQLQLGVRVGGASPSGEFEGGYPLGDLAGWTLPVGLEVGWRFGSHLALAAQGSYAFGFVDSAQERDCDALGQTCSLATYRVGLQATWSFRPAAPVDPWLGVGAGYEWLRYTAENASGSGTLGYQGFEWVRAQGGVDFRFGRFAVGPYLSYALGAYAERSLELPDGTASESVQDEATHGWLEGGARCLYTF